MDGCVAAFIADRWRVPRRRLRLREQRLRGGLESRVRLIRIGGVPEAAGVPERLVLKELPRGLEREAGMYEWLWRTVPDPPAVRMVGRQTVGSVTYLYLEDARPCSTWPWSDPALAGAVCRALARFHDCAPARVDALPSAYEAELARSAADTLALASRARDGAGRRYWTRLGDLRRVVARLPAIRGRLLAGEVAAIHGDVHPGNVCVRRGHPEPEVVMIDWGRARTGSPLEDVASWLHSLGCWEPQARRRHDTLMRSYLKARAVRRPFGSDLRAAYWFASASNGLSGAVRYHLAVLLDPASEERARRRATRALAEWQRVVRRAAALLSTSQGR